MRVLLVNKFYYIKGGSETYYFSLKKMLKDNGHEVIDFSMQDDKNLPSEYQEFFVENVDYSGENGFIKKWIAAKKIIYSTEAKKKFEKLVLESKPDLVHLNIFQHQISPSILDVIKKYNLPTVYTAHDLKMICLNYKMMINGRICEQCKGGRYFNCLKNKCVKDSYIKSCVNVIEGYLHKWKKSYDVIDFIITPSKFYRNKFIEFGIQRDRIFHLPNFLPDQNKITELYNEEYYLYFGRLSEEKGVKTLLEAAKDIKINLWIVGTGPLKNELEEIVKAENLYNIKILGYKSGQELTNIVGNSKAVILPSEWYENGPYSAIEALQLKRPILGADIGGIPELVHDNGFLFKSGDQVDLKKAIEKFEQLSQDELKKFQQNSYLLYNTNYLVHNYYKKLCLIYNQAIEKKRGIAK